MSKLWAFADELTKRAEREVYYHGSPRKLTTLRAGSWVTPHREDALRFGIPWGSKDLEDKGDDSGRPPHTLNFKPGKAPPDAPVYVYRVEGEVEPAATNTGRTYDWNRKVTKDTRVTLVDAHDSWRGALEKQATADPEQLARMRAALTQFLTSHGLPADAPHTVIAGGAMYGHGLRPQFDDVDVVVPGLRQAERFDELHGGLKVDAGRTFKLGDREMTRAVMRDATRHPSGLHLMSPQHILAFKQHMNRPKDQADIATLKAHLTKKATTSAKHFSTSRAASRY